MEVAEIPEVMEPSAPAIAIEISNKMFESVTNSVDLFDAFCKRELDDLVSIKNQLLELCPKKNADRRKLEDVTDTSDDNPSKKRHRTTKATQVVQQTDTSTPNEKCVLSVVGEVRFSTNITKIFSPTELKNDRPKKRVASSKADLKNACMVNMTLKNKLRRPNDEPQQVLVENCTQNSQKNTASAEVNLIVPYVKVADDCSENEDQTAIKDEVEIPVMPPPKAPLTKTRKKRTKNDVDLHESKSDMESDMTVNKTGRNLKSQPAPEINVTRVTRSMAAKSNVSTIVEKPSKSKKRKAKTPTETDEVEFKTQDDNISTTNTVVEFDSSFEKKPPKKRAKQPKLKAPIEKIEVESKACDTNSSIASTIVELDNSYEKKPPKKRGKQPKIKVPFEKIEAELKTTNTNLSTASTIVESDNSYEKKPQKKKAKKVKPKVAETNSTDENSEKVEEVKELAHKNVDKTKKSIVIQNEVSKEDMLEVVEHKNASPVISRKTLTIIKSNETVDCEPTTQKEETIEVDRKTITSTNSTLQKNEETINIEPSLVELTEKETTPIQIDESTVISKASDETIVIVGKESETKKPALDETIIITGSSNKNEKSPVSNKTEYQFDETIVLSKNTENASLDANKGTISSDHSVLTDYASEIEDTPVKVVMPSILPLKKNQIFESPVKSKVRHFEKLAELANCKQTVPAQTNTNKNVLIIKQKTRNNSQTKIPQIDPTIEEIGDSPDFISNKTKTARLTPCNLKKIGKCNLPLPVASKDVGSATKKMISNSSKLFSPNNGIVKTLTQAPPIKDATALKRELHLKKLEEQKKKREEKFRAAALAREAQEKHKLAAIERNIKEKNEKIKPAQHEIEERAREEAEKKKLARLAQLEELRRQEADIRARIMAQKLENRRQQLQQEKETLKKVDKENLQKFATTNGDLAMYKKLISSIRVSNYMPQSDKLFDEIMELDEELEAKDASSSEKAKACERLKPSWAKKINIDGIAKHQRYLDSKLIDKMYSVRVFSPDLAEIFPNIDRAKLKRTSSAVWKTPPRCSMMPKYN